MEDNEKKYNTHEGFISNLADNSLSAKEKTLGTIRRVTDSLANFGKTYADYMLGFPSQGISAVNERYRGLNPSEQRYKEILGLEKQQIGANIEGKEIQNKTIMEENEEIKKMKKDLEENEAKIASETRNESNYLSSGDTNNAIKTQNNIAELNKKNKLLRQQLGLE